MNENESGGGVDPTERTREFFDRPPPPGYLDEWTARLAKPDEPPESDVRSLLIFRLGAEWLALPMSSLVEVTAPQPIHSIPHRTNDTLLGLVNIRGQIRLCVSLHEVLGAGDASIGAMPGAKGRMVIVQDRGEPWVFPADEVYRAVRLGANSTKPAPSTLRPGVHHTKSVFRWSDRTVGELDHERLLDSLRGLFT